jgi:hypothetical protein
LMANFDLALTSMLAACITQLCQCVDKRLTGA